MCFSPDVNQIPNGKPLVLIALSTSRFCESTTSPFRALRLLGGNSQLHDAMTQRDPDAILKVKPRMTLGGVEELCS